MTSRRAFEEMRYDRQLAMNPFMSGAKKKNLKKKKKEAI